MLLFTRFGAIAIAIFDSNRESHGVNHRAAKGGGKLRGVENIP